MMPRRRPSVAPLRTLRLAAGLTQFGLAAKAGVSLSTVANNERGMRVSDASIARLALALGCKPEDIQ
jgi:transcriptional regulator with XRE-family HTH domain